MSSAYPAKRGGGLAGLLFSASSKPLVPLAAFTLCMLSGCISLPAPPAIVQQPMSARAFPAGPPQNNGAIYQASAHSRPLFEDRRARQVGDTLVIQLNEQTNASKKSNSSANKSGQAKLGIPPIVYGVPLTKELEMSGSSATDYAGKGEAASTNNFNGTIAVTVIDVLPNNYLLVSGEKQLAMTQGTEYIRFSGVVRPETVFNNTVSSVQVADARIEYKANGYIDEAQTMGWLSRFFLTVSPF